MTDEELIEWLRKPNVKVWADGVAAADRIEQLTEQLAAARRDAEIAEEELELQEEEACMMENSYFELEKELNTCRMAQAVMDNTVADLEAKLEECEARLGKAVEALEPFARAAETWEPDDGDSGLGARIEHPHHGLERHAEFTFGDLRRARATLAEIKGESHD